MIQFRSAAKFDQAATLILLNKDQLRLKKLAHINHPEIRQQLTHLYKNKQFFADQGEIFPLALSNKLTVVAGLGEQDDASLTSLRIVVRQALLSLLLKHQKAFEIIPHKGEDAIITAIIEGIEIGSYTWSKYRTQQKDTGGVQKTRQKKIYIVAAKKKTFEDAVKICSGVTLTRNLVNDNADVVTSVCFERVIKGLIKGHRGVSAEILNEKQMKLKGLRLHLAVNQGSRKEPKLIIVRYHGASRSGNYTALVGKGITFDTGGLNLKPTGSIETMRCDMSGAAAVVGVLKNTIALKIKKNILFVCALAENVTGSGSYKPGDVIKSYNGKTVEIGNTDAEGRLVLADALSYVVRNYKPKRLIDIATLTGACVVALGNDYTGLVTIDDEFSRQLVRTSNETDDRVWRLPSYPELKNSVKSQIADIRNLGFPRGAGGTITAAEFLRQFTDHVSWAHLDIAGTAFVDGKQRLYFGYGATGAGVRLLTHYLKDY